MVLYGFCLRGPPRHPCGIGLVLLIKTIALGQVLGRKNKKRRAFHFSPQANKDPKEFWPGKIARPALVG